MVSALSSVGVKKLSSIVRDEHKLMAFENRMLRIIFGSKAKVRYSYHWA
jgi:hypothetical protein